jgi:hypothetical protein
LNSQARQSLLNKELSSGKADLLDLNMEEGPKSPPHVLIFPLPAQGHVNSMLKLAELLSLAGIHVTFLNTVHNHDRLVRYTDVLARFACFPGFQFKTIPDGLPAEHPRAGDHFMELFDSLNSVTMPIFRKMLFSGQLNSSSSRLPVSCIIADGIYSFPIDVGDELGIPVIHFRTISACSFWAYFRILDIIEAGELPIRGIYSFPHYHFPVFSHGCHLYIQK